MKPIVSFLISFTTSFSKRVHANLHLHRFELISFFHFLQSYKPSILMLTAVNMNATLTLAHVKTPQQCTIQELCVTHDSAHQMYQMYTLYTYYFCNIRCKLGGYWEFYMKSSNRLFEYTRSTLILFFHSTFCVGVTTLKWTEPTAEVYSDSVSPHFLSAADRMILRLLSLLTAAALVHSGEIWTFS